MSDKKTENQAEETASQPEQKINQSIGQILKTARKSQNLDIEHVCNQLNLSSHVVEALESDNYEGLPEIAYVRGYIVSYCRLLGLDSFKVLKQLVTEDSSLSVLSSITTDMNIGEQRQGSTMVKKLIPVLLIAGIAVFAAWFFSQKDVNLSNSNDPAVADTQSTNETTAAETNPSSDTGANVAANNEAAENTGSTAQTTAQTTEQVVDEAKESLLELEFNAVSWVDIQNTKKEKLVYQSFPRGEKHQVKAELPLNIFIDNANSVFVRYEGRLIDLKPYIQDGYAKFTLSE